MSNIEPSPRHSPAPWPSPRLDRLSRQTARALASVDYQTLIRAAQVRAEGMVSAEKLVEVDRLTQTAMSGHALLSRYVDVLAGSDPILHDELKSFADFSRVAKADVLMDAIHNMRRI